MRLPARPLAGAGPLLAIPTLLGLCAVGRAQDPSGPSTPGEPSLEVAVRQAWKTGEPSPARAAIDREGPDAARVLPLVLQEYEREDPATWLTAASLLARLTAFLPADPPPPRITDDPARSERLRARAATRGGRAPSANSLRNEVALLEVEVGSRALADPRGHPSEWVTLIEQSRNPFTIELAADLLRTSGAVDERAVAALTLRLVESVDEIRFAGGLRTTWQDAADRAVARTLATLATDDPRAALALGRVAFDRECDAALRTRAVDALDALGRRGEGALPALRTALEAAESAEAAALAVRLVAGLGDRALSAVPDLRRLAEDAGDDGLRAVCLDAVTAIETAALGASLGSSKDPSSASPRALAIRKEVESLLDQLLTTDDPELSDQTLERLAALGPFTAHALVDRILAGAGDTAWARPTPLYRLRAFRSLAQRMGPAAGSALRRLREEIPRAGPEVALRALSLLAHWLPWCDPFAPSDYPLLDDDQLTTLDLARRAADRHDRIRHRDVYEHYGTVVTRLADPQPVFTELDEAELLERLDSTDVRSILLATAALNGRTPPVGLALLDRLEVLAASAEQLDLVHSSDEYHVFECRHEAAHALLHLAPERLDSRAELEGLLLIGGVTREEATRAVRHLGAALGTPDWLLHLLFMTLRNARGPETPELRRAILERLQPFAPLADASSTELERLLADTELTDVEKALVEKLR